MTFPIHDESSAPDESRAALASTRKNFGMIPNLERVMASAPSLLKGYSTLWDLFDETTLSPVERQVVYLTANYENECDYCIPWHSLLAKQAGMSDEAIKTMSNYTNSIAGTPLDAEVKKYRWKKPEISMRDE